MKSPEILCAKCRRPVEWITSSYDPSERRYHFIVHCHGEKDECFLDEHFLQSGPPTSAIAFKRAWRLPVPLSISLKRKLPYA